MKVLLDTNGCTLGQLESKRVQQFLEANDGSIAFTSTPTEADILIFYACGLTDVSEAASLKLIGELQSRRKPSSRLVVWGCLTNMNPEALSQCYDGPRIGPQEIDFFNGLVESRTCDCHDIWSNTLMRTNRDDRYCGLRPANFLNDKVLSTIHRLVGAHESPEDAREEPFYLRVSSGCTGHCTYCSEKLAWGALHSRDIDEVKSEFRLGREKGYRTFVLCAEDLGCYGQDLGCTCIDLVKSLIDEDRQGEWRLLVDQFNPEFLDATLDDWLDIFSSGRIRSFGCQVQSGSNRVLKLMGRRYRAEDWKEAMTSIKGKFPGVFLGTHMMVGFPSETEADFRATLRLLDHPLCVNDMHVYVFSKKSRAAAARMKEQVPESVKKRRAIRLWRRFLVRDSLQATVDRLRT